MKRNHRANRIEHSIKSLCLVTFLFCMATGCGQRNEKSRDAQTQADTKGESHTASLDGEETSEISQIGMFGEITSEAATNGHAGASKMGSDDRGAIEEFTKAIKLNPKIENFYIMRASCKINLEDYTGTLADLNKLVEMNPKDASFYRLRGIVETQLKNNERALADFKKAGALDTNYAAAQTLTTHLQYRGYDVYTNELRNELFVGLVYSLKNVVFPDKGKLVFQEQITISVKKP